LSLLLSPDLSFSSLLYLSCSAVLNCALYYYTILLQHNRKQYNKRKRWKGKLKMLWQETLSPKLRLSFFLVLQLKNIICPAFLSQINGNILVECRQELQSTHLPYTPGLAYGCIIHE
jgi:hypothetical protein